MSRFDFDAQRYPAQPGCYLMKDAKGRVLYVGKAKNLRRRLASYFRRRRKRRRIAQLVTHVDDVEVILVNNEVESLVLENNLIKRYKPRYNRMLKGDDTGYPYIALTGEVYPRFVPYRKDRVNKGLDHVKGTAVAKRFGPYLNTRFRDALLAFVCENFQTRTCKQMPRRACLRYEIGKCSGICEQRLPAEEHAAAVNQAAAFLSQQQDDLVHRLRRQMRECAERLEFEKAQRIRDRIEALESALQRQIVERDVGHDQDVIFFGQHKALVSKAKAGAIQGLRLFDLDSAVGHAEACAQFLVSHYRQNSPRELIVNRLGHSREVERVLSATNQYRVKITLPTGGVANELLKLCELNYAYRISIDAPE